MNFLEALKLAVTGQKISRPGRIWYVYSKDGFLILKTIYGEKPFNAALYMLENDWELYEENNLQ